MNDKDTSIQTLKDMTAKLWDERDWGQFHSPKNLSAKIAIEAAELMELLVWGDSGNQSVKETEKRRAEIEQELADVIIVALTFANVTNIDIAQAVKDKLALTAKRYPVELSKGKCTKYTKL